MRKCLVQCASFTFFGSLRSSRVPNCLGFFSMTSTVFAAIIQPGRQLHALLVPCIEGHCESFCLNLFSVGHRPFPSGYLWVCRWKSCSIPLYLSVFSSLYPTRAASLEAYGLSAQSVGSTQCSILLLEMSARGSIASGNCYPRAAMGQKASARIRAWHSLACPSHVTGVGSRLPEAAGMVLGISLGGQQILFPLISSAHCF